MGYFRVWEDSLFMHALLIDAKGAVRPIMHVPSACNDIHIIYTL